MPYMIYQQYITAIKENYAGHKDLDRLYQEAKNYRKWLENLQIEKSLRDGLAEPISAIEGAFKDLEKIQTRG